MRAGWLWSAEDLDEEDPDEAHGARLALLCAACPAGSKTRARGIDAGILAVPAGGRGRPTFRAGKKLFAVFSGGDEHPFGVIFKPELGAAGAGGGPPLLRAAVFRAERLAGARFHGGAGRLGRGHGADGELLPPGGPAAHAEGPRPARLSSYERERARRSTIGPAVSMVALETT